MTIGLFSSRSNGEAWQPATKKAPWWSAGSGTHAAYVNGEMVASGLTVARHAVSPPVRRGAGTAAQLAPAEPATLTRAARQLTEGWRPASCHPGLSHAVA
jgi:hypothetical protein